MGKRLAFAKQPRRNLFSGNPAYKQLFSLRFADSATEAKYQTDAYRFTHTSLQLITLLTVGTTLLLWTENCMSWRVAGLCVTLLLCSLCLRGPGVRLAWALPNLLLANSLTGPLPSQQFCALLPGFCARKAYADMFTASHWSWLLLMLTEAALASNWTEVNLVATGVLSLAAILIERVRRDQWVLYHSSAQSEEVHFRLFTHTPSAIFILSSAGRVLTSNHAARDFVKKQGKPLALNSFQDLFAEEFAPRFRDLLAAAMRGEEEEEELFLKSVPSRLDAEELRALAVSMRLQPCVWHNENCVRVTCSDISPFITRRLFLLQLCKGAYSSLNTFLHVLKRLFLCGETVQTEDMFKHNKQACAVRNVLTLQSHFLGRIEMTRELFHVRNDIASVAEFARLKAESLSISLNVAKDSIPFVALGDRHKHTQLLTILLDFVLEQAQPGSEVALTCALGTDRSVALYRVAFRSSRLDKGTLDRLFVRRQDRKTLQEMVSITAEFGVGLAIFDTLLAVLRGSLKDAYTEFDMKVVLAYE